jgi:hypothetical protein
MWTAARERFDGGEKVALIRDGARLSFAAVLEAWRGDSAFSDFFLTELAAAPFAAFYWEMPPIVAGDIERPYEYATIDSPTLRWAREDGSAFGAHLSAGGSGGAVTAFPNPSGKAMLVAPLPIGADAPTPISRRSFAEPRGSSNANSWPSPPSSRWAGYPNDPPGSAPPAPVSTGCMCE